ncbi:accessory factor UbiK family protein [Bartonella sp. B10834G6]|uniref:BMFP domain-containing protein YqiC n=1 Tax=Bartonella apis TaxID=1686310 RepID=A0A1R0F9T4_9HYPH|nr:MULTISPECIES: accessory factor UbiK family protein [Bartonella]MBH9982949.1 accessory factor UbiK family protein [Bartonella apis]MBH9987452.1 accessory factor UbiK family protein [Bartonella apis]MBI0168732.1 accessory factor UbiK family protein [Bartonella sp. W8167]MBI0171539.1 accessory factor UbiK family protein [Bartonella sp. W8151]MBI0175280.1 accessory factor UbiK family protein [Bartonella apis]
MNNGPNRVLDELAKLMTDAAGAAQGVRKEAETAFRAQAERVLNKFDFVHRDEFEVVKEMAAKAREEVEELKKRLDKQENKSGSKAKTASTSQEEHEKKK